MPLSAIPQPITLRKVAHAYCAVGRPSFGGRRTWRCSQPVADSRLVTRACWRAVKPFGSALTSHAPALVRAARPLAGGSPVWRASKPPVVANRTFALRGQRLKPLPAVVCSRPHVALAHHSAEYGLPNPAFNPDCLRQPG